MIRAGAHFVFAADNSRKRCDATLRSSTMEWLYSAVGISVSQSVTSCAMDQDGCRRHTLSPSAGLEAVSACNSMPPPVRQLLRRRKAVDDFAYRTMVRLYLY